MGIVKFRLFERKTKDAFLMTIIPAPQYMEYIGFGNPMNVTYIGRDKLLKF